MFRYHLIAENLLLILVKLVVKYETTEDIYIGLLYFVNFWGALFDKTLDIGSKLALCAIYLVLLLGFAILVRKIIDLIFRDIYISLKFFSKEKCKKYKNSVIFIIIVVSTLSAEPELISGDIMIRAGPVTLIEGLQSLLVLTIFSIIVATGLKILNRTFMK